VAEPFHQRVHPSHFRALMIVQGASSRGTEPTLVAPGGRKN
jgi:hypothetical protein